MTPEQAVDLEWRRSTHREGVWWHEAPKPRRLHRCTPWSREYDARLRLYWLHCACGGVSREDWAGLVTPHSWINKNSREAA